MSRSAAPATQNECHHWSASHMKRHFQCAEQVKSPSNLTKYCAYHEILKLKISADTPWMLPPIERRFEDIRGYPTIIRTQNRHLAPAASETLLFPSWRRFCIVKYNISRSGYLPKCHEMLRLPRKVTLQPHQILRLPRKMNRILHPHRIWNVISNARSQSSHPLTSANTAPATQNECRLCYFTKLVLCGTVILPIYYFADLLLYRSVTLVMCYFTELVLCGTVSLPMYYFADLLLNWSVTLVMCYFTELVLCGTVSLPMYYFTDLLL